MADNECTKCIHKEVCKTAESCDGYVSGCKHFKEQKKGRMDMKEKLVELIENAESQILSVALCCTTDELIDLPSKEEYIADHLIANGVTVQELDGCEYCKEYEDLPEHFVDGKPVGRVFDTCIQPDENGLWHLEVPAGADIGIRFCPMCGRELPQPPKGE